MPFALDGSPAWGRRAVSPGLPRGPWGPSLETCPGVLIAQWLQGPPHTKTLGPLAGRPCFLISKGKGDALQRRKDTALQVTCDNAPFSFKHHRSARCVSVIIPTSQMRSLRPRGSNKSPPAHTSGPQTTWRAILSPPNPGLTRVALRVSELRLPPTSRRRSGGPGTRNCIPSGSAQSGRHVGRARRSWKKV